MSNIYTDLNFDDAVQYHYEKFPPNGPSKLDYQKLISPLAEAHSAIARFDTRLKDLHNPELLIVPLRNREALLSSRIEGTFSTMDEILQHEADHNDKTNTVYNNEYIQEVLLYQETLGYAQEMVEQGHAISQSLIKKLHQTLLRAGRGANKSPGQYKDKQNFIVDKPKKKVLFVPIRPESMIDGMERFFNYINDSSEENLLKTAVAHVEFEALHPFQDGNGRIGRMLVTLMLWHYKIISSPHFHISQYFEKHKDSYMDTMRNVSQNDDWTLWCRFFLTAVKEQADDNLKIADNITVLYERMKKIFREKLSSRYHDLALDFVFTNPIFKNNKFTKNANIPSQTANNITNILLKENLIRTLEQASGRKSGCYVFEPLLELIRV